MNEIGYFDLINFINSFEISQDTLEHLAEVQEDFDKYFKKLLSLGENAVDYLMIDLYNELAFSNLIEGEKFVNPNIILQNDLFNVGQILTNETICNIQKLLMQNKNMPYPKGEYRKVPVFIKYDGKIVYHAPKTEDTPRFMQDFITFYNRNSDNLIDNDPFIKAALLHFLFVKIHPFVDGNGRVTRILQNIKFTELVNHIYSDNSKSLSLKICPLNISYSIFNNKSTYYGRLREIPFSEGADINKSVNKWLQFLLYMYEEQLNYCKYTKKIDKVAQTYQRIRAK